MKHSPFTAIYDANVLYPAPLRDFLMNLALTGIYRARWSASIHDEWKRNLLLNRPDLTPEHLDRTSSLMDAAVPDALVTDYDSLVEGLWTCQIGMIDMFSQLQSSATLRLSSPSI